MTLISGTQTIGNATHPFIGGTRIWRGDATTFTAAGALSTADNVQNIYTNAATDVLTASNSTISCTTLRDDTVGNPTGTGLTQGTWNLDNVILDTNDISSGSVFNIMNWDNVTLHHTPVTNTTSSTYGNWHAGGSQPDAPWTLNNVNFWPSPVGDGFTSSLAVFLNNGGGTSTFNSVSFWNGQTGDQIRGTGLYSGPDIIWNSPVVGPIGFTASPAFGGGYNPVVGGSPVRILLRFSGSNVIAGSLDYRGIQNNNDATWRFIFDGDGWLINPLVGEPTNGSQAINVFNGSDTTTRVLVGTGVDTQSSFIKYINADTDHDMYTFPAALSSTNLPSIVTSNIVEDTSTTAQSANGIAFEHQAVVAGTVDGGSNPLGVGSARWNSAVTTQITTPSNRPFRTYSWDRTQWSELNIITTPQAGADDAEVATARGLGYDTHNGTAFTSTTNYDNGDTVDTLVSGYSSPAVAGAVLNTTGGVTTGRDVGALIKTVEYNDLDVNDGANQRSLPYTHTGTSLDFGASSLIFSDNAANYISLAGTITIPSASFHVDTDEVITAISAANMTLTGDYTTTDAKVSLTAASLLTVNGALSNANVGAATLNATSNTFTDVTFRAATITNWLPSSAHTGSVFEQNVSVTIATPSTTTFASIDDILGTHTLDPGVTLTLNSPTPILVTGPGAGYVAGTNVSFQVVWGIENDRTDGLLSVWRNGTLTPGITTAITNILPNEVVDVIYSESGRTDYVQRITAGVSPDTQTFTVTNAPTPYPTLATVSAGTLVPVAPIAGVMGITVTENQTSAGAINRALQEQVKETIEYNTLLQQTQQADIIGSDGPSNAANADQNHIQFNASEPVSIGYVRPTAGLNPQAQDLAGDFVDGTFTPDGGGDTSNISVGVTLGSPDDFDPAITGSQVDVAVSTLGTRFDTVDTSLTTIGGDVGTAIGNINTINTSLGAPADAAATGDTATLHARQKTIEADTHDMRSNRLLGLKPQSTQT